MTLRLLFILTPLIASIFRSYAAEEPLTSERIHYDVKSGLSSQLVGGGVQDRNGLMWFATWNGLNCYDGYDFHHVNIQPGDGASISTNRIRDIFLSDDGNIICHTDEDIFEFNLTTYSFRELSDLEKARLIPKVGQNWLGTTDSQGNLWNADPSGLYKTISPHHPAKILKGTEGENPRAFLTDADGSLFVGLRTHPGIAVYNPDGQLLEKISLPTVPYCIYRTKDGGIWTGGKPGALIRLGTGVISDDQVYDMAEDSRGHLWIATFGEGIKCCPDPSSPHPEISGSFGGDRVRKIIVTPSDNIIAATSAGLLIGKIDPDDYKKTKFQTIRRNGTDPESLSSDATMSVARDRNGMIYIATESSGVDMISEEDLFSGHPVFTHLNSSNSVLFDDIGKAMSLCDDTLLMIVGNDNIQALNPMTRESVNFSKLFWGESCDFGEATPVRLPDGTWAFGGEQGAFLASPHSLYTRGYIPPIVFTTIAINGGAEEFRLPASEEISLKADQRNITIGFAALDYVNNEDILYRTRLDGSPWTSTGSNRSVTLFNLPPGEHKLEVQSTDRYGRTVDNTVGLTIYITPYWYERWWARILFIIAGVGLIAGVIAVIYYVRNVNRQRRELYEKYMALMRHSTEPASDSADGEAAAANSAVSAIPPSLSPEDAAFLAKVRRYIEENLANPDANIDDMGMAAAASRSTLNRKLHSLLGVTASKLLNEARMLHAAKLLGEHDREEYPVAKVAEECGFADRYYFQRVFKSRFGVSPADFTKEV